jgi:hypothetical protein
MVCTTCLVGPVSTVSGHDKNSLEKQALVAATKQKMSKLGGG